MLTRIKRKLNYAGANSQSPRVIQLGDISQTVNNIPQIIHFSNDSTRSSPKIELPKLEVVDTSTAENIIKFQAFKIKLDQLLNRLHLMDVVSRKVTAPNPPKEYIMESGESINGACISKERLITIVEELTSKYNGKDLTTPKRQKKLSSVMSMADLCGAWITYKRNLEEYESTNSQALLLITNCLPEKLLN